MSYYHEFRNFDFDIPHIEGFIDTSWHNDVSPKFERKYNETQMVRFWVDYADENKRECGGKQFIVTIMPNDELCNDYETILETNSWDEAINAINKLFNEVK